MRRPTFVIQETLRRIDAGPLHRALRDEDQRVVLLEVGSPADVFELTRGLSARSVLRPIERVTYGGVPTLVLEDFDGVPLRSLLERPVALEDSLVIALRIAEGLAELHADGVVHKDIRPDNILVARDRAAIKLIGFGVAERSCSERAGEWSKAPARSTPFVEGSLPYISPEQTGRMLRPIDQRSDLYSLGVTLYELFTGARPFEANDLLEWVYCHVAREPLPPATRAPSLPQIVSDIIERLLAKVVDERYQTAGSVAADLARCLEEWSQKGAIEPFALGTLDVEHDLRFPERLYGREAQIDHLLEAFHRVLACGAPELVLVSGHPGVGKSSLIRALHRPIVAEHGAFIVGKADQYNRSVPYSTLATALRDLVLETLAKDETNIAEARNAVRSALGDSARVVIDVIPEVALLIGEQPSPPPLPPAESKYRFLAACHRFVGAFARKGKPVAIFLDDLQWADSASLELLEYLLTHPDTHDLLAFGAYRDSEVSPSHPLVRMIEDVRRTSTRVTDMCVWPLTPEHVTQLVADVVHEAPAAVSALALLVHRKTQGNPFFAVQFMRTLQHDGLLAFDGRTRRWHWNVQQIEASNYADNVVELMIRKIESLPDATRTVLKVAACIGTLADARTLMLLAKTSEAAVHRALEPAVQEGLLLRTDGAYRFLHDRLQQAAHSLIAEDEQAAFHLAIGRSLSTSRERDDERPFEVANHFLLGVAAIAAPPERTEAAHIFLEAGKRAKAALAYRSAVTFFAAGVALLEPDSWSALHEVTYDLHLELAECEWLTGDFDAAARLLPRLLAHARTVVEKFRVYGIRVRVDTIRSAPESAATAGLEALRTLGIEWTLHPGADEVQAALDRVWDLLGDRPIEALLDLPPMTDPEMQAAVELVSSLTDTAFFVDWNLHSLFACFLVSTSLQYGNAPGSFMGYAIFALFICTDHARPADARRFAEVAYASLQSPSCKAFVAKICTLVGGGILDVWLHPYRHGLAYLERGAREGAEIGDLICGSYCANNFVRTLFSSGESLDEVLRESERRLDYIRRAKYDELAEIQVGLQRFIRRLRGGATCTEEDIALEASIRFRRTRYARAAIAVCRMQEAYLFGDYDIATQAADEARSHLMFVRGLIQSVDFHLFEALILAAVRDQTQPALQARYDVMLAEHELQYRTWSSGCPENFGGPHALIVAELARINGKELEAERAYEEAITQSREAGLVQIEAIANELAARFHRARGLPSVARMYLRQAHAAFGRWGAHAKVKQLERTDPELFDARATALSNISSRSEQMDLLSVVKASQTISGELDLQQLSGRLIQVVLEQSGAQLGRLLLLRDGELWIESDANVTSRGIETRSLTELARGSELVPESIVRYVRHTREKVLLTDAVDPGGRGRFPTDEYLARVRPKSVLCMPIVRGDRVIGILYLENNLVKHAFTPEQMGALDLLASQAAITMDVAFWIRQEREARTALERSESRFRRLSDSKVIGVIIGDRSGRLLEANDCFLETMGFTREELKAGALCWRQLTPPEYAALDAKAISELDEFGVSHPYEKVFLRKDGAHVPVLLAAAFLEGSKDASVAYVLDISERKLAERERDHLLSQERNARAEAEAALRARDDFLSIAAHELRTPLTPLKMQIEVLAQLSASTIPPSSADGRQLNRLLESSNRQLDQLVTLIGRLLDVAERACT
jgi:PAS domain S-box-containing protein